MTTTWWDLQKSIRDEVREYADELTNEVYPENRLHEMADGWVPAYNSDLLNLAADSNELALNEPEILAFDGTATPINAIASNVYEGLLAAAYDEWETIKDERENDDDT